MFVAKTHFVINNLRAISKMETSMIIARMQHIGPRGTEPVDQNTEQVRGGHRIAEETYPQYSYKERYLDQDAYPESAQSLSEKVSEIAHHAQEKLGELAESAKQKIKEAGRKLKDEE